MSKARVSRLRGIALAAPKATAAAEFYVKTWGLAEVAREPGAVYLRASGPEHHVLSLHDSDHKGIAYLHFATQDVESLKGLFAQAKAAGARIVTPLGALDTPGGGMGFEVADPENRRLRISTAVELYPDAADAADKPRKITHVVLNAAQLETSLKFYEDVLGFKVSDWSEN